MGQGRKTKPKRPLSYWRRHREQKCWCSGYWFPHRRGGGACVHCSRADFYAARRSGLSLSQAQELLSVADLRKLFPVDGDS